MKHSLLGLAATLLLISGCLKPPMVLTKKGAGVEVSVSTLGEYPTSISRVRLEDAKSGAVIWELRAKGKVPQIWGLALRPGRNATELRDTMNGQYGIIAPKGNAAFFLEKGRLYVIAVWNERGTRNESARFSF